MSFAFEICIGVECWLIRDDARYSFYREVSHCIGYFLIIALWQGC